MFFRKIACVEWGLNSGFFCMCH